MLMNWGEMFKLPTSRRVQRNTQYCMCTISDNSTYTKLLRVPNKWKYIEQEGTEMVWTGRDLEKWTNRNWQIFLFHCSFLACMFSNKGEKTWYECCTQCVCICNESWQHFFSFFKAVLHRVNTEWTLLDWIFFPKLLQCCIVLRM